MPDIYIGSSKVSQINLLSAGIVQVTVSEPSGTPPVLEFTQAQFDAVKSDMPYSDSDITNRKWRLATAQIIGILLQNNMQMVDLSWVLTRLRESIIKNYQSSIAKKFGVDDEDHISLTMIDEVLKSK